MTPNEYRDYVAAAEEPMAYEDVQRILDDFAAIVRQEHIVIKSTDGWFTYTLNGRGLVASDGSRLTGSLWNQLLSAATPQELAELIAEVDWDHDVRRALFCVGMNYDC